MKHGLKANKIVYLHRMIETTYVNGKLIEKDSVVYVGSGSLLRCKSKKDRSKLHLDNWDKIYYQIVKQNLTQDESFAFENKLLKLYWSDKIFNIRSKVGHVNELLYEQLSKIFYLDEDGVVRWAVDRLSGVRMKIVKARKGDKAGYLGKKGYWFLRFNGKAVKLHRVVWVLYNKCNLPTDLVVDHIDRNTQNNSPENLRAVTYSENNKNRNCKMSEIGLKRIRFSEKQKIIHVQWVKDGKKLHKYFCMIPLIKKGLTYEAAYETCLTQAKLFVEQLETS